MHTLPPVDTYKNASKIIAFWGIGSGADPAHRNIGWNIATEGWQQFVDAMVRPAIEMGVTRFWIHNPAGTEAGQPMQADQFARAREAGLYPVLKDFVQAWKPITARYEVVAYLGLFEQEFMDLAPAQFLDRVMESYRLPIEAGMSIGFDAMFQEDGTRADQRFMRLLQSLGVKTYVEPWPRNTSPQLFDCNNISTVQLYNHKLYVDPSWAAAREKLTGEIVIALNSPMSEWDPRIPTPPRVPTNNWANFSTGWGAEWCREIIAQGFTALIGMDEMVARRQTLESWLEPTTT